MAQSIFVTGAGGFIGQTLLARLSASNDFSVKMLLRRSTSPDPSQVFRARPVIGDLLAPEGYVRELAGCDTVVHLAAVTGKAAPGLYERVNVEGTRRLLQACKAAGVRRFLYVSTIAAGYPDKRHYPYAVTKAKAEILVRESGLAHAIVRPTLVLGARSPIWQTLLKIARLPVLPLPLPQSGRAVSVQPIHVDDVTRGITLLLESGRFESEVLELGGSCPLPFSAFLETVQIALRGEAVRIVRVPLGPARSALALIEPVLRPLLPVTAGQLALFANDSTASENWLLAQLRTGMPTVEAMIADLVDTADAKSGRVNLPLKRRSGPLTDESRRALEEECCTFSMCLVRMEPSAYVREQYARAVHRHGLVFDTEFTRFDRVVLVLARRGSLFARCADAYCALFHRRGVLRRKLIVLAAILEHATPTSEAFDVTQQRHPAAAAMRLVAYSLASGASLIVGAIVLIPASILCWIANVLGGERRASETG
jgi:nucleoside-diphosphate-sugar epimerase